VPPEFHPDKTEEKRIYDLHENDPHDPGYRRFLSRLAEPLLVRLEEGSRGLDFGCGPGPALAMMLEEAGHAMALYDLFYRDDRAVLKDRYDFICATEVIEHLGHPAREVEALLGMLKEGGLLALMTKLVTGPEAFSRWHYIQDQTHICFYSRETFRFLAERYGLKLEFVDRDVIFLRKG
jgi:cyclopropane fatty-acyl-phospholipid synthase-like methyltransferase